jgi:hypothetical protein
MTDNPRIEWEELLYGKYTNATVEFMLKDMYAELRSVTTIAALLGVSRGSVLRKLRMLDVTINKRGGKNNKLQHP